MPTVRAEKTKRKVKRAMKKITIPAEAREVAAELLRDAEIKVETTPTGRVPGLTIGATKTTYNYQDLVRMFPIVSFIPEETIPLTFQGVKVQAYVGIEMHVPKCFKDIFPIRISKYVQPISLKIGSFLIQPQLRIFRNSFSKKSFKTGTGKLLTLVDYQ
ncbi:hypothetical protein LCGC14_2093520 [marine sediment metagenome]|uniref:Uncharacterized protein n=1 Tax=marine sediment metagenome TaxID=412755 RepID=A0A0F9EZE3_9ZZZZ